MKSMRTSLLARLALPAVLFNLVAGGCTDVPTADQATLDEPVAAASNAVVPPSPTDKRYLNVFQKRSGSPATFNWLEWAQGTREVQIAGKTIVFDAADEHKLVENITSKDVTKLEIYADVVIVKRELKIPGAEVRIHARELRFEDVGGVKSIIDTTPLSPELQPPQFTAGKPGYKGGDVVLHVNQFFSQGNFSPRFRMTGGKGQDGGIGAVGEPVASRPMFKASHDALWQCAKKYGMTSGQTISNGNYVLKPVPFTLSELESQGIAIGQEFPEDGKPGKPGGKPGNAGDGGSLYSSLPGLAPYVVMNGGSAGKYAGYYPGSTAGKPWTAWKFNDKVKCKSFYMGTDPNSETGSPLYETRLYIPVSEKRVAKNGESFDSPPASKPFGAIGTSNTTGNAFTWLHPHAVAMELAFVEDAYLNGFRQLATAELTALDASIDAYQADTAAWNALSVDDRTLLEQEDLRTETLLTQLTSNEDFFGNPVGWTPTLSLDVTKAVFENEIQWAIKTIYVADWLQKVQDDASARVAAIAQAKVLLGQEISRLSAQFNESVGALPSLQQSLLIAATRIQTLEAELQLAETRLAAKAQLNVEAKHKLPFWKKGLRILASVARLVPVGQPYLGAIGGTVLDAAANFNTEEPWESIKTIPDVAKQASDALAAAKAAAEAAKKAKDEAKPEEKKSKPGLKDTVKDLYTKFKPVIEEAKKHKDLFKAVEAPKEEVQKELERLKGEDPEFKRVTEMTAAINKERETLAAQVTDIMSKLEDSAGKLGESYLALSELLPEQETTQEVVLSQRGMMAIADMRAKAVRRLLKYHYLLARSYEYAMLQPYTGDLTLTKLFQEILNLVNATNGGTPNQQQYEALFVVFREEISALVEEVISNYADSSTRPTQAHVFVSLTADELASLNDGQNIFVDFAERGVFGTDEENLRIVDIKATNLQFAGPSPSSPNFMDLSIEHSGLSRLYKDGQVHVFQHYNKRSRYRTGWETRTQNGVLTQHQLSDSAASLLRSLLADHGASTELFARPAAWAKYWVLAEFPENQPRIPLTGVMLDVTYEYEKTVGPNTWSVHKDVQNASIRSIYVDVLGREPSDGELRQGREMLDLGYAGGDIESVVHHLNEGEIQALEVDRLYVLLYARAPSAAERAWWSAQLVDGRPTAEVQEYIQLITDTIAEIYGRQPTYGELKLYTKLLDDGLEL